MLTGKQKRFLRSEAHSLSPVFQVGKEGVTDVMIKEIKAYLEKHELMKVSVLNNCLLDKTEVADIFQQSKIDVVQVIGNTIVLYKSSRENRKIILP